MLLSELILDIILVRLRKVLLQPALHCHPCTGMCHKKFLTSKTFSELTCYPKFSNCYFLLKSTLCTGSDLRTARVFPGLWPRPLIERGARLLQPRRGKQPHSRRQMRQVEFIRRRNCRYFKVSNSIKATYVITADYGSQTQAHSAFVIL